MTARLAILVCLLATVSTGGCRHETIAPMPDVLPSAGVLLQCRTVPLGRDFQLRRFEVLRSDVGNEFYPFNVPRAAPVGRLVSKLYVRRGIAWQFVDFVEMPEAESGAAANLSSDGQLVIYERPKIADGEGQFPRAYPRDRRTYQVCIYDRRTGQRFTAGRFSEVYGLGSSRHWRADGEAAAISTTCFVDGRPCPQLAILNACGQVVLDAATLPELRGLEFICYCPGAERIAALRPARPRVGGRDGGTLVEVDVDQRTVKAVGEIPAALACKHLGEIDRLVEWTADGHCRVRE